MIDPLVSSSPANLPTSLLNDNKKENCNTPQICLEKKLNFVVNSQQWTTPISSRKFRKSQPSTQLKLWESCKQCKTSKRTIHINVRGYIKQHYSSFIGTSKKCEYGEIHGQVEHLPNHSSLPRINKLGWDNIGIKLEGEYDFIFICLGWLLAVPINNSGENL